jgi:hypothetical protein
MKSRRITALSLPASDRKDFTPQHRRRACCVPDFQSWLGPLGQSRRTTMLAMSGLAPIAAVMLQCQDRSKSAKSAAVRVPNARLMTHEGGLAGC